MSKTAILIIIFLQILSVAFSKVTPGLTCKTDSNIIYDICFSPKGGALAIADNTSIKVYSTDSMALINEFKNGHKSQILSLDISKDSSLLVSGGKDSTIVIWDFAKNRILKSLTYHKGMITTVKISPDMKYIASGGTDNKVFLYDIEKNEPIQEFTDHKDDITSVIFSPDGKFLASAGGDKSINIYDIESRKLIQHLAGNNSWVRDIALSKDGTKLGTCGDDAHVVFWSISAMNNIIKQSSTRIGYSWLLCLDFSIDNTQYATGSLDGKVRITGRNGTYTTKIGFPVNRIKFKPNEGSNMKIALATIGNGVIMIDASEMSYKSR